MTRKLLAIALLFACGFTSACATRSLRITTEPPGATVFMDNKVLGVTPLEMPFTYGGHRELLLLHDQGVETDEGIVTYRPLLVAQRIEDFWFDTFPFDVFTSLSPVAVHDRHELHFVLEEDDRVQTALTTGDAWMEALLARADRLKAQSREAIDQGFPSLGDPLPVEEEEANPAIQPLGPTTGDDTEIDFPTLDDEEPEAEKSPTERKEGQ